MKLKHLLLLSTAATLLVSSPLLHTLRDIPPAVAQSKPSRSGIKYKTYIEPKFFSIDYPSGWFVQRSGREVVIFTSLKPKLGGGKFHPQLIKTDVLFDNISFEEKFKQTATPSSEEGDKLTKVAKLKIGGQEAYRLWFTSRETDILITLVKYTPKKTAYIASFYTPNNSRAIPIAQKMHNSFRVFK